MQTSQISRRAQMIFWWRFSPPSLHFLFSLLSLLSRCIRNFFPFCFILWPLLWRMGTRWWINLSFTCGYICNISLSSEIHCDDIFSTPCTQTKAPVLIFSNVPCQNNSTTFPVLLCLSIMSWLPCPGWEFFFCVMSHSAIIHLKNCMKTRNLTDSWDSRIWCWHLTRTPNVMSIYRARSEAPAASSITIQVKQVTRSSRDSNAAHLHLMSH